MAASASAACVRRREMGFEPGDIVCCEKRSLTSGPSAGAPALVAVERVSPTNIAYVGGGIDEVGVCFAMYGEDLDPTAISPIVGCEATSSHRRGDRRGPHTPPSKHVAWFLQLRGRAPRTVDDLLTELLGSIPLDAVPRLRERYEVQIRIALHMDGWNKGFQLSPDVLERLASLNVPVLFDVYSYAEP